MLRALRNDVKPITRICLSSVRQNSTSANLSAKHAASRLIRTRHRPCLQEFVVLSSTFTAHEQLRSVATKAEGLTESNEKQLGEDAAPQPPLAIVFTDIVKSTTIWEKDSEVMVEAMRIHDGLIRNISNEYNGYEVKQNGDGFMIAFQSAVSALHFCLEVQTQLQVQEWPKDLLQLRPAEPIVSKDNEIAQDPEQEEVLWKGLRLRMSIHFGEPICVWNDVIQRMDYLGPPVNRAARFVSVCEGGQVIVSDEFLQELVREKRETVAGDGPLFEDVQMDDSMGQVLDQAELNEIVGTEFEIRVLGSRHFRGVQEKQRLFFIVPKSLKGRLQYFGRYKYVQASKGNLMDNGN